MCRLLPSDRSTDDNRGEHYRGTEYVDADGHLPIVTQAVNQTGRRVVITSMKLLLLVALAAQATLQFEVASIRRNVSGDQRASFRGEPNGRLTVTNNTLFNIVRNTYSVQGFQIVAGAKVPDWFDRDRWDIVAKAPEGMVSQPEMVTMMQALLADRFKLVARRETREMPVYALVLAKADGQLGPQLRQADGQCEAARLAAQKGGAPLQMPTVERGFCGTRAVPGNVSTSGVALADFARNLAPQTGRFVIDRTGLSGTFDLDLKWTPDQPAPPGAPSSGGLDDGTSLFAALQEQLGMKLEAQRAPVDVLVIESAERPSED